MTGYPSIDKPWLKYYPINRKKYIHCGLYQYLHQNNLGHEYDVAMMYMGKKWTFGDFFTWVNRMSGAFIASGICAGDKVIVLGLNTPDIICAIYALNNIGAVCCIEYITQKEQELENACQAFHATAAVVIDAVIERYYDSLKKAGIEQIFVSRIADSMPLHLKAIMLAKAPRRQAFQLSKAKNHKEVKSYSWNGDETAIILSTSGTTGIPKKAELSNNALNALAYQAGYADLGLTYGTTLLSPCPPFLAYGISLSTHLPLCNGVAVISFPSPDPKMVTKQFAKYKPNFFICGRTFLDCISSDSAITKMDLSFVKAICIGGEAVSQDYRDKMSAFIRERGSDGIIITGYGMLCLSGKNVFMGYFNEPELTWEATFTYKGKKYIKTGTNGKLLLDGSFELTGRASRFYIISSLNKVYCDYVQQVLNAIEPVKMSAVVKKADKENLYVGHAFIILKDGYSESEEMKLQILNSCKKEVVIQSGERTILKPYEIPADITFVDSFPLTKADKVNYLELEKSIEKGDVDV